MVSMSATRAADASATHVSFVNVHPSQGAQVSVTLTGVAVTSVAGRVITAAAMDAHNTFAAPDRVKPASFAGATLAGETLSVMLPAKSVVMLALR